MKLIILLVLCVAAVQSYVVKGKFGLPTGRIVGGVEARPHSAPYIVSLRFFGSHFCAGSLIAEDLVLTAAHCLAYPSSMVSVVAGAHNVKNTESTTQTLTPLKFVSHENYGGGVGPYDIGLIRLNKPFQLNENVNVVRLPEANKVHSGQVTLYGWGSTSTSQLPNMPDVLQTVKVPLVPYKECEDALGSSPLAETNVCTGPLTGGTSACSGDSGGPLVKDKDDDGRDEVEMVGVVSWGYVPCGSIGAPSVYTRVSAYNDWIASNKM